MDESSTAVWVAVISVAGVVFGSVIAGLLAKDRWPNGLSDARRLGELIDKMDADTPERALAAEHRDDLVVGWVMSRTSSAGENWRTVGIGLSVLLAVHTVVIAVGVPASAIYLASAHDVPYSEWWPVMFALLFVWAVVFALFVIVVLGWVKRWKAHLESVRASRGMRTPLSVWLRELERDRVTSGARRPARTTAAGAAEQEALTPSEDGAAPPGARRSVTKS